MQGCEIGEESGFKRQNGGTLTSQREGCAVCGERSGALGCAAARAACALLGGRWFLLQQGQFKEPMDILGSHTGSS